jgi:lipoyl(octanoyl) transferase
MNWRLLLHPGLSGAANMAIDEALFLSACPDRAPVLRFYTWDVPTLSLGCFQSHKKVVSEAFCVHNNINVVRRPTGGRAVLHQYEVTYAVVAPLEGWFDRLSLRETYQLISKILQRSLQKLGVNDSIISKNPSTRSMHRTPQCFVSLSQYELSSDTKKIIGSAQKRSRERFLQHGSILLDFDSFLQQGCIQNPDPELADRIAPLQRLLGRTVTFQEISSTFAEVFAKSFDTKMESSDLDPAESLLANQLEQKYRNVNWIRDGCK